MKQLIIEIDITHRCNLICRHCNRLCNAENQYAIVRNSLDMDMRHIDYLCREIKSVSKGSIGTIRILGGEPLLSKILEPTVQVFELLKDEGYISNINIVTNGTLPIPVYCSPYIVFAPQIVGQMIKEKCRPLTKDEIYSIKNIKHRNITLSPEDIGADYKICERVNICGVHYTVYGFSYTAPCFPCIMAKQSNHKYFLHEFPKDISMFLGENFENDVCSLCTYAIENYKLYANKHPEFQSWNHCGTKWKNLILSNKVEYVEPDTSWINKV